MAHTLSSFPEELLEKILSYLVIQPLCRPSRPLWHRPTDHSSIRGRLALLLVSKAFHRIAAPLFYHTIHVTSPSQLQLLVDSVRPNPQISTCIRRLIFAGVWSGSGDLLKLCHKSIRVLDITLDGQMQSDAEDLASGLTQLKYLTHFTVRKPNNVYLTHPVPRCLLSRLAKAVDGWNDLEFVDLAFRISDDGPASASTATSPPQEIGPITALTFALSTRPQLHTFCTLLPSLWNQAILRVSANQALERIILGDGSGRVSTAGFHAACTGASGPAGPTLPLDSNSILGTGLYFTQAKKHPRLCDLIRAGTLIMRTRAQTMGTPPSPLSPQFAPEAYQAQHQHMSQQTVRPAASSVPRSQPSSCHSSCSSSHAHDAAYPTTQNSAPTLVCLPCPRYPSCSPQPPPSPTYPHMQQGSQRCPQTHARTISAGPAHKRGGSIGAAPYVSNRSLSANGTSTPWKFSP